jgi:hypothetical protein
MAVDAGTAAAAELPAGNVPDSAEAPMCDPMGASIAARPDIPEVDGGRLENLPCEALLLMTGWRLDSPELAGRVAVLGDTEPVHPHQVELAPSRYDGACDFHVAFPSRVEPALTAAAHGEGLAPSHGHRLQVYRPPVA